MDRPITFERLLPLTGLGAAESGVYRRILGFFVVVPALIFAASWPSIAIPGFRSVGVAGTVASTSQPAIFARTKAGHKCSKSCHSLLFFLSKVSGEPFITDVALKCRQGFGIRSHPRFGSF